MPDSAEVVVTRARWNDETLDCLLRDHAALRPDALAITDPPDIHALTGRTPQQWTWAGLDHEVERMAAVLLTHGVRRSDTVATQLPAGAELVRSVLACWRIGAVAMPLSVGLRDRSLTYRASRAGTRTMVTGTRVGPRHTAATAVALPCFTLVFACGPEVPSGAVDLDAVAPAPGEPDAYLAGANIGPEDRAVVLWTASDGEFAYRHRDLREVAVDASTETLVNTRALTCPASFHTILLPWLRSGCRLIHPKVGIDGVTGSSRIPLP